MKRLNSKNRKTLESIFRTPALSSVRYADIERLLKALGFAVQEGRGSRVRFINSDGITINLHKPHPGSTVLPYVVRNLRKHFEALGIAP